MKRTHISKADFETAANGVFPGPDLTWFAVDRDLLVGGFCNAGFAVVPQTVFRSLRLFNQTQEAVALLPRTGNAISVSTESPLAATWDRWSQQGLFAYDWYHASGQPNESLPYRLMCRPEVPLHLSALPPEIAAYIWQIQFKHLSFRDTMSLLVNG